jgi:dTDP-4-amino-4,6-dideoxygalactose transaminase
VSKPFIPFHRPSIGQAEIDEVVDTLRSGWLTTGPKVKRFEAAFAEYAGSRHALAVSSGTAAMHLALAALGIGPGDEVITTPMTFCSTAHVIVHLGATPVFADVCDDDLNMDPEQVERRLSPRTRALLPVHYGGQPCRMDELLEIARRRGLAVVEDAAHAVSAEYRGRRVGSMGDVTAFSFYATKNLATGEGGMTTTDDDETAAGMRRLALHGMSRDAWDRYTERGSWYYEVVTAGYKYNMTDLQAALGLHQLARQEELRAARERHAARYSAAFAPYAELIQAPVTRPEVRHAWHLYPLRVRPERLTIGRDEVIERLRERGIGTSVHFIPVHQHPYYREEFGFRTGDYPVTEAAAARLISLPLYPDLTEEEADRVARTVIDVVTRHARGT